MAKASAWVSSQKDKKAQLSVKPKMPQLGYQAKRLGFGVKSKGPKGSF